MNDTERKIAIEKRCCVRVNKQRREELWLDQPLETKQLCDAIDILINEIARLEKKREVFLEMVQSRCPISLDPKDPTWLLPEECFAWLRDKSETVQEKTATSPARELFRGRNIHVILAFGEWASHRENNPNLINPGDKKDVIKYARETAMREGVDLLIHDASGKVVAREEYR